MVNAEYRLPPPDPSEDYPYTPPSTGEPEPGYGVDLSGTLPTIILYTNAKGGAMLFEHGNYRWLQPSEVAAARTYIKANGGAEYGVDDNKWAELVSKQRGAGSSDMATQAVPGGGYASRMSGFDAGKLADLSHQTPKYIFARLASNFDTRDPAQRTQLLALLRADPSGYFRNASFSGDRLVISGTLDPAFGGIDTFDVFGGSQAGLWTPTWQPAGGPGYKPETVATTPVASAAVTMPTFTSAPLNYTPRDYGPPAKFAPIDPYQGMSPEAYRLLAAQPSNSLAALTGKR